VRESTSEEPVVRPTVKFRVRVGLEGPTTFGLSMSSVQVTLPGPPETLVTLHGEHVDLGPASLGHPVVEAVATYVVDAGQIDELAKVRSSEVDGVVGYWTVGDYTPAVRDLCHAALDDLRSAVLRLIELVRWRLSPDTWSGDNIKGDGSNILCWSADRSTWVTLGNTTEFKLELAPSAAELSEKTQQQLSEMAASGEREPLGREIWHAGVAAHNRRDYRTAIILGVSAVEIELKKFIGERVPQAHWLLDNLTAPPVYKMVRDYLPELLTETEERLSDAARGILFDAVERRNTFVHAGEKAHKKVPAGTGIRRVAQGARDGIRHAVAIRLVPRTTVGAPKPGMGGQAVAGMAEFLKLVTKGNYSMRASK